MNIKDYCKTIFSIIVIVVIASLLNLAKSSTHEEVPETNDIVLKGETKEYSYNVMVPQIPALSRSDPINMLLVAQAEKVVTSFIGESTSSYQEMKKFNEDGMGSYLNQSVEVAYDTDRFTALLVEGEQYGAGAAHPNHYILSYVYDKTLRKMVSLTDLFSKEGYLTRIAQFAQQSFKERAQKGDEGTPAYENLFLDGFIPTKDNYSVFIPKEDGLTFYFGEYQIAAYVYGMQKVTVPYSILAPFINKDSALGNMVK